MLIPAVSGVVMQHGRMLFVRRRYPPNAGKLALPGGKIQLGETPEAAVQREMLEETGLLVQPLQLLDAVAIFGHSPNGTLQQQYLINSYWCRIISGKAQAQSDASALCWLTKDKLFASRNTCSSVLRVANRGFALAR